MSQPRSGCARRRRLARGSRPAGPSTRPALALLLLGLACLPACRRAPPRRVLWAWERASDLGDVPPTAGVAYLAATIELRGAVTHVRPRSAPLRLPPRGWVMPVVRIEPDRGLPPVLDATQRAVVLRALVAAVRDQRLQIDFEARPSQRPFYRALLDELRRARPHAFLSVTALTWWCAAADRWVDTLPIDEVVPMFYRLSDERAAWYAALLEQRERFLPRCRIAMGIALDELPPWIPQKRNLYIFAPHSWTHKEIATWSSDAR